MFNPSISAELKVAIPDLSLSVETARIWSLTATADRPSQVTGMKNRGTGFWGAGKWNHDDRPPAFVQNVNRDNNARSGFADFRTEGGIEGHPPDFAACRNQIHGPTTGSRMASKSFSSVIRSKSPFAISQARIRF